MLTVGVGVRFFSLMHAIQSSHQHDWMPACYSVQSDIAKSHEAYDLEKANVLMLMSTLSHPTVAKKKIDKKIQIGHFRVQKTHLQNKAKCGNLPLRT